MSAFCECGSSHQNLGVKNCSPVAKTKKKDFFVPTYDSDGNRNYIDESDFVAGVLPDSYIVGKLNESDPSKRWYPTPSKYENVTPGRTDSKTKEYNSGSIVKIENGVRNFEGTIVNESFDLASKMNSFGCSDFSTYEVFIDNAMRGEVSSDGTKLYPLKINAGSLDVVAKEAIEGSDPAEVVVKFQYDNTVDESKLKMILGSDIETDLLKVNGLLDGVTTVLDSPAITNATASANVTYSSYGTFAVDSYIQGLDVVADWELKDGVTPVVIASIDDLNGDSSQLDFTFTSTPSKDLTLTYIGVPSSATLQGFDIPVVTFTTPA